MPTIGARLEDGILIAVIPDCMARIEHAEVLEYFTSERQTAVWSGELEREGSVSIDGFREIRLDASGFETTSGDYSAYLGLQSDPGDPEQPLVHIRLQQAARHSDGEVDLYDLPAMEADTEGLVFSGEAPAGSPEDIGMSEFSLCGT